MAAKVRCKEIRDEAVALVEDKLNAIKQKSQNQENTEFAEQVSEVLRTANEHFETHARQYDPVVFKEF